MHAPTEALDSTVSYIKICAMRSVFVISYNVIGGVFRGIGYSKTPLITVRISVSFIMSKLEPVSLFNVGLATPMSTFVQIILCISYFVYLSNKLSKEDTCLEVKEQVQV